MDPEIIEIIETSINVFGLEDETFSLVNIIPPQHCFKFDKITLHFPKASFCLP